MQDMVNPMENIIEEKSFSFAIRIVKLCNLLRKDKREYVLSKQLLRCGTSIGANVAEAQHAQTKADFVAKMNISLKETGETLFWLRLLNATNYLSQRECASIFSDCVELEKILVSIINSAKG